MPSAAEKFGVAQALRAHWPEYLMEAWGLGTFMVSAGLFATLLEYPGSPVYAAIPNSAVRLTLMGFAMGLTAVAIIFSPWGKQSGAHINPAVTLAFLRLGKIHPIDAAFYILAQFLGGTAGIVLVWALLGSAFSEPPVAFINTPPGDAGVAVASLIEAAMAGGLMLMVLTALSWERTTPHVGYFAGAMVASYIICFAPLSGVSINPARTFASAAPSGEFSHLWLYFTAPILGMLGAVELFHLAKLGRGWFCAKLNHDKRCRCIHCGYDPGNAARGPRSGNGADRSAASKGMGTTP